MPQLGPSTAEADATLSARIAELLELRIQSSDNRALERRRAELRTAFQSLSAAAALPLLIRLREPDPRDPLSMLFKERLASATREEMLGYLEKTVGSSVTSLTASESGKLPRAAAESVLRSEIDRQVNELLALAPEDLIARVETTLDALQRMASDPLFAAADPAILRAIAREAKETANLLTSRRLLLIHTRRRGPLIKLGIIPLSPATEAEAAWAGFAAAAAAATASVSVSQYQGSPDSADVARPRPAPPPVEPVLDRTRELRRRLTELAAKAAREREPEPIPSGRAPFPTPAPPRNRRRRRPCGRGWVSRSTGDWKTRMHNEFAAAMVAKYVPHAPPGQDYQITKGGLRSTQYDSYDEDADTYYEFKTRHQYVGQEGLTPEDPPAYIAWMRKAEIISQATDQRETLVRCASENSKLVWIFDTNEAANAVRAVIGGWLVDEVIAERWDRKDRAKTKPHGAGGSF
jgi:hypothetical protein